MPLPDLCRSLSQKLVREAIIAAILGPPPHKGINVTRVVGVKLLLHAMLWVGYLVVLHATLL
jgi:hypothetical protein